MKKIYTSLAILILLVAGSFTIYSIKTNANDNAKDEWTLEELLSTEYRMVDFTKVDDTQKTLKAWTRDAPDKEYHWLPSYEISFSKEKQQQLIEQIEQFKLIKTDNDTFIDAMNNGTLYSFMLKSDSVYSFYIDTDAQLFILIDNVDGSFERYSILNGDAFVDILLK